LGSKTCTGLLNQRTDSNDTDAVLRAYERLAPLYDFFFGKTLDRGRKLAVHATNGRARRVLEVGVGTGISLPFYRRDHQVTGVDISPKMLERARERVATLSLSHVKELLEMDASHLGFADNSFDAVIAMYVMPVVPAPDKVLREIERVCAPGGKVIVVNHFAKQNGLRAKLERRLVPICEFLGWRIDFCLDEIVFRTSLSLRKIQTVGPFGLYTLLQLIK
jgi:phosphatidylethanolamine/phosphatidyl-N-methylethanolamine N-methyltransferase